MAVLLDGGMGHLLRRLGVQISGPVGSSERFLGVALANVTQPDLVRKAHRMYIDAGAEVITTNSYACVPHCLSLTSATRGNSSLFSRDELRRYITAAGKIAREAADSAGRNKGVRVAGCLPPLGPSYRTNQEHSDEELRDEYRDIAQTIAPFSDVLLCETMVSIREGKGAAQAASKADLGLPIWVSFTVSDSADGTLRSGEPIESAAIACAGIPGVEAVMVNCSSVEATAVAVPKLRQALPDAILVGAYANGMTTSEEQDEGKCSIKDVYSKDVADSPKAYAFEASKWVKSGATIVGGCCGIFPEQIEAMRERLFA